MLDLIHPCLVIGFEIFCAAKRFCKYHSMKSEDKYKEI